MSQFTDSIAWVKGSSSRSAYRTTWPLADYIFSPDGQDVLLVTSGATGPYSPTGPDESATDWTDSNDRPPHK